MVIMLAAMVLAWQFTQVPILDALPAKPGTAIISGHVTDKETGLPLAGIVIRIPQKRVGDPVLETRTDADGVYQITRVPAGSHILVALMPDYRTTHLPQVYGDSGPSRARWTRGVPPRIEIKDGETRTGLDFALVRALGVSGRVMDEAGQPMSGVRVRIESLTSDDATAGSFRDTDDRGEFRVFGLAPGRYRICAEPTRFNYSAATPPDAPAAACLPASSRADDALTIGNREPAPVEIRMVRAGTLTISGAILDAFGAPAEGATLSFARRPANGSPSYGIAVSAAGQFMVRGVSPGDYSLTASGGRAVDNGQIERQYAYVPVHVGSGDIAGLTIRLISPVNVTGRIVIDDGTPLPAGVRLSMQARLDTPTATALNRAVPTGIVHDDMRFELPGVFGAMTLSSTGLPHGWIVKAVRYEGIDVTDRSFTPGGDAPSIDVVISSRGAIASGTVPAHRQGPRGALAP